jgi:hypothetical protein
MTRNDTHEKWLEGQKELIITDVEVSYAIRETLRKKQWIKPWFLPEWARIRSLANINSAIGLVSLTSCSKESKAPVADLARKSDFVALASVGTNSGRIVYRLEKLLNSRTGLNFQVANNAVLPGASLPLRAGYFYGERAIVFLNKDPVDGTLHHRFSLYFHNGRADDETLDQVIAKIKGARNTATEHPQ